MFKLLSDSPGLQLKPHHVTLRARDGKHLRNSFRAKLALSSHEEAEDEDAELWFGQANTSIVGRSHYRTAF